MTGIHYKGLAGSLLDVDEKSRRVKNALNKVGIMDSDKDIVEKSAFDKTISERGPKGSNLVWHLTDHNPSLKSAVGKFKELFMEGDYLVGITDIPNTQWGNDVLEFYKSGMINQHSIGFSTMKREVMNEEDYDNRYTIIKEVKLFEASSVLWGANEFTPNLSVGKSMTKEEAQSQFDIWNKEFEKLTKLFKTGHLTDDTFELLEIKIKQLQTQLSELFNSMNTTPPAVKAVEPEVEDDSDLIEKLMLLNLKLKAQ